MTKLDQISSSFSHLDIANSQQDSTHEPELDLDTVVQNDTGRKLFTQHLKEFNNSCDKLVTLYLICCCFQNQKRLDDRQRIKQILEKTYNVCCIRNELTHLSPDLKQKLGESLQRKTYNESIFNAVKSELKTLLETNYFPQFLESHYYTENAEFLNSLLDKQPGKSSSGENSKMSDKHSTSLISLDSDKKKSLKTNKGSSSFFAMPNVPSKSKPSSSSSSRMLKQSKSSSSSTSSVTSMNSITKASSSGPKTLRTITNTNSSTKTASKSSLSKASHYKSNTSINSLPPNPYHVMTKAIHVSAHDSERQSVMSADDIPYKSSSLHNGHLPKMNRQIKENLLANKDAKLHLPEMKPEQATQPMKKPSSQTQIPLSESNPKEFFKIIANKLEDYIAKRTQSKHNHQTKNLSLSQPPIDTEVSFIDTNNEKLAIPYESDIDAQLDEHLNRVYNTNENPNTSKMSFVRVSSLARNQARQERSLNQSTVSYTLPHPHQSDSNPLNSTVLTSSKHHHFYKLTSTSKEVDIDDTTHQTKSKSRHHHHHLPSDNYDSGVSIRSAASIERVNEWLNQSSQADENVEEVKKVKKIISPEKKMLPPAATKKPDNGLKTTVAYYLPGEDLAYISTFNGEELTLAQFKQLIAKKGDFKYFFKTKSDLLDEECVVYQEATDENSLVPMFNNKVIAKIQTC